MTKELFDKVFDAVKRCENENECPLIVGGVWLNTVSGYDIYTGQTVERCGLDWESDCGCGVIRCDADFPEQMGKDGFKRFLQAFNRAKLN